MERLLYRRGNSDNDSKDHQGISTSIAVAIAIGVPIVLLILVLAIMITKNYKRSKKEGQDFEADPNFAIDENTLPDFPDFKKRSVYGHMSQTVAAPPPLFHNGNSSFSDSSSAVSSKLTQSNVDSLALPFEGDAISARSLNNYAKMLGSDYNPYGTPSKSSFYGSNNNISKSSLDASTINTGSDRYNEYPGYKKEMNESSSESSDDNTAVPSPSSESFRPQERNIVGSGGSRLKNEVFTSPEISVPGAPPASFPSANTLAVPVQQSPKRDNQQEETYVEWDEDPSWTPEEEEKHRRMKSVYQVYFDRGNSVKENGSNKPLKPADFLPQVPESERDSVLSNDSLLNDIKNDIKDRPVTTVSSYYGFSAAPSPPVPSIQRDTIDLQDGYSVLDKVPEESSITGGLHYQQSPVMEYSSAQQNVQHTVQPTIQQNYDTPNYESQNYEGQNYSTQNYDNQQYEPETQYQTQYQGQYNGVEQPQGDYGAQTGYSDPQAGYGNNQYGQYNQYEADQYNQYGQNNQYQYNQRAPINAPPAIPGAPVAPVAPVIPLAPLKKLPTPAELSESGTNFMEFATNKNSKKTKNLTSPTFNNDGTFPGQVEIVAHHNATAPSASAVARSSIVMLNTVGFGAAKKYKPAGVRKAAPVQNGFVNQQSGPNTAKKSNQKDLRRMLEGDPMFR